MSSLPVSLPQFFRFLCGPCHVKGSGQLVVPRTSYIITWVYFNFVILSVSALKF
jgi:hypothetical protein